MPGYFDGTYGSKKIGLDDDKSYLYGSAPSAYDAKSFQGSMVDSASLGSSGGGVEVAQSAAGGAAMGGPAGAAMAVGGSFLSNYLAQKAADERAKRDRAAQIEQNYAQNQNQGFDTMMRTAQGALR